MSSHLLLLPIAAPMPMLVSNDNPLGFNASEFYAIEPVVMYDVKPSGGFDVKPKIPKSKKSPPRSTATAGVLNDTPPIAGQSSNKDSHALERLTPAAYPTSTSLENSAATKAGRNLIRQALLSTDRELVKNEHGLLSQLAAMTVGDGGGNADGWRYLFQRARHFLGECHGRGKWGGLILYAEEARESAAMQGSTAATKVTVTVPPIACTCFRLFIDWSLLVHRLWQTRLIAPDCLMACVSSFSTKREGASTDFRGQTG
jgi:hypothetical protein